MLRQKQSKYRAAAACMNSPWSRPAPARSPLQTRGELHSGKVSGLRARGNFQVDIEWKEGMVTSFRVVSDESRRVKVRIQGETRIVTAEKP